MTERVASPALYPGSTLLTRCNTAIRGPRLLHERSTARSDLQISEEHQFPFPERLSSQLRDWTIYPGFDHCRAIGLSGNLHSSVFIYDQTSVNLTCITRITMARTMLPEEYREIGRSYYKLKQYEKALETFSKGIEACPTADLYDHRSATYDKLGNLNAAVKDGREMIRLNKKDVKGYLRTANVLEKMEKPETALGIHKYGMKNVPVSDKNFKVRNVFVVSSPSLFHDQLAFLWKKERLDWLAPPSWTNFCSPLTISTGWLTMTSSCNNSTTSSHANYHLHQPSIHSQFCLLS
jgi:tetratricopeptide (TPR) repeat protein